MAGHGLERRSGRGEVMANGEVLNRPGQKQGSIQQLRDEKLKWIGHTLRNDPTMRLIRGSPNLRGSRKLSTFELFKDAQKGKLEELDQQNQEAEAKSSSQNKILLVLIVLIVVTWGIAATAYFGIVDYKGLLAKGQNISAAEATDYVSNLYPFQYDFIRHPLKSIGNFLTSVDDKITDLLTFDKAPYLIVDKRRPVVRAPVRSLKRKVDLSKRDAEPRETVKPTEQTPPPTPTPKSSDKKQQEQQQEREDVEKPKPTKTPEKPKQPEPTTPPPAEEPKPTKVPATKQQQEQTGNEKPKVFLTLNLQLVVGKDQTINSSHLVSENGSVILIGTDSSKIFSKNRENMSKWDKKAVFLGAAPINKANIVFSDGNPPVRRLVLEGRVINKRGYCSVTENLLPSPPMNSEQEDDKTVVPSVPIGARILPIFGENLSFASVATKKISADSGHSNVSKYSGKKLVIDTNPFVSDENPSVSSKNSHKNHNSNVKFCHKACFLGLHFLNKNFAFDNREESENMLQHEERLTTLGNILNKNEKSAQKSTKNQNFAKRNSRPKNHRNLDSRNHESSSHAINKSKIPKSRLQDNFKPKQKFYGRIALPNVVPKYYRKNFQKPGSDEFLTRFGQKNALPNPTNKHWIMSEPKNVESDITKNQRFREKMTIHSETISIKFSAENGKGNEDTKKVSKRKISTENHIKKQKLDKKVTSVKKTSQEQVSQSSDKTEKSQNSKNLSKNTKSREGKPSMREIVVTRPVGRVVKNVERFMSLQMLNRGIEDPCSNRFIREFRGGFASHRLLYRNTENPSFSKWSRSLPRGYIWRITRGFENPCTARLIRKSQGSVSHKLLFRKTENPSSIKWSQNIPRGLTSMRKLGRGVGDPHASRTIRKARGFVRHGLLYRRTEALSLNKRSQNLRGRSLYRRMQSRDFSNPSAPRLSVDSHGTHHLRYKWLNRGMVNPFIDKVVQKTQISTSKMGDRIALLSINEYVRSVIEHEKRLILARLATSGTTAFARQISMAKLRDVPGKRTPVKLTPRLKLKRKLSRMFDRTCDIVAGIAHVIKKLNIFERTYQILPKRAKNFLQKAKNVTIISKVVDVILNTTLNDAYQFTLTTSQKVWAVTSEKVSNFYNFLNEKPSFKRFFEKTTKFKQKLNKKFEKLSAMIARDFLKLQKNQKLLTAILVTLSILGLYHIFFSCVNSIFGTHR